MTNSIFSLFDKKIVFTGATGVLGSSICHYLANQGAQLILVGRTKEKVDLLQSEIIQSGGKAVGFTVDVTDEISLEVLKKEIKSSFGFIDILINGAGGNMAGAVITPDQTFLDLDSSSLRKVIDLNYLGTVLPIKALLPLMLEKNTGNIINFSSMAASRPMTRVMGYASSKAAIDNLTKFLSVELAKKHGPNFRVNALAPGFFLTEQNRALLTKNNGSLTDRGNQIIVHTPMDRFGKPEDLHGAMHWLCSEASLFVTGTVVAVDGGFSAYSGV